jgi:hypothetical protein
MAVQRVTPVGMQVLRCYRQRWAVEHWAMAYKARWTAAEQRLERRERLERATGVRDG